MKKLSALFLIAMLFVTGCQPSESAMQTAIAQTQVAIAPTQTASIPTPIPLSEIDLESIRLLPGDLLDRFVVGGQIHSTPSDKFVGIPSAVQIMRQGFSTGGNSSDGITIILYESLSDIDSAYNSMSKVLEAEYSLETLPNIGEKASMGERSSFGSEKIEVIFTRCHAIVYIDLYDQYASAEVATTYAQRLDKRLKPLVCP